jgi:hypothetical protein
VAQFYSTVNGRWTGTSYWGKHGIALHVASSLYECSCYIFSGKDFIYYLHHVVTIGCCLSMLLSGRAHVRLYGTTIISHHTDKYILHSFGVAYLGLWKAPIFPFQS